MLVLMLGYLLMVVAVDHWLMPIGVFGRWLSLIVLLSSLGVIAYRQLVPLIFRRINPVYAARAIESCTPSLKNSLINYLLLRREVHRLAPGMYVALEDRAAHDIQSEHVDAAIDKTLMVRYGYALATVIACCAIYKVASPKDSFQSLQRVIMPWSRVEAPTRFQIVDVTPKNHEVFLGSKQTVTVKLAGANTPDAVELRYSTTDGRHVDRQLAMHKVKVEKDGIVYAVELFEESGLDSSLDYRILAGDARSSQYRLDVTDAPLIRLESVEYTPPSYTNEMQRFSTSPTIHGLEGTHVKIHAEANLPIKSAQILFDVPEKGHDPKKRYESIAMQVDDKLATAEFTLALNSDRKTAIHSSYCILFTTTSGQRNDHPVTHRIQVESDLKPMVEILEPTTRRVELPLDRQLAIEVRAVDPDFGLIELRLEAVRNEQSVFVESLLESPQGVTGQVVETYTFRPLAHELAAGDVVRFRGFAADNRQWQGEPAANIVNTLEYEILIAPPMDPRTGNSGKSRADDAANDESGSKQRPDNKGSEGDADNAAPNDKKEESEPRENRAGTRDGQHETKPDLPDVEPQETTPQDTEPADSKQPMPGKTQDKTKQGGEAGGEQESGEEGGGAGGAGGEGVGGGSNTQSTEPRRSTPGGSESAKGGGGGSGSLEESTQEGDEGELSDGGGGGHGGGGADAGGRDELRRNGTGDNGTGHAATPDDRTGDGGAGGATRQPVAGRDRDAGENDEDLHDGDLIERLEQYVRRRTAGRNQDHRQEQPSSLVREQHPAPPRDGDRQSLARDQQKKLSSATDETNQDFGEPTDDGGSRGTAKDGDNGGAKDGTQDAIGDGQDGLKDGERDGEEKSGIDQAARGKQAAANRPGDLAPRKGMEGKRNLLDDPNDQAAGEASPSQDKTRAGGQQDQSIGKEDATRTANGSQQEKMVDDSSATDKRNLGQRELNGRPSEAINENGQKTAADSDRNSDDSDGTSSIEHREGSDTFPERPTDGRRSSEEGRRKDAEHRSNGDRARQKNRPGTENEMSSGERQSEDGGKKDQDRPSGRNRSGETGEGGRLGREHTAFNGSQATYDEQRGNVEFAETATELVLDYLRDQQSQPDNELLDEVGWTKEDLRAFVQRWDKLQRASKRDESGKRQWTEALKSLGLKPVADRIRQTQRGLDSLGGNAESGGRSQPPAKYLRQFNAFRKSAAKAESESSRE
jgi:hypothetical protein